MTALIWNLEWARTVKRRRLLYLNVAVPLLLVAPIALGDAPAQHAAVAYATLFVFFATFGSAIPAVRDGTSGLLGRILMTGTAPHRLTIERTLAASILDLSQLLPSLLLIAVVTRPGLNQTAGAILALALALVTANMVGAWVAALARSIAEAALFGAVLSLLLLHASGVFRTASPGSVGALIELVSPYRALHELTLGLAGGSGALAAGASLSAALLWAGIGTVLTGLAGAWILGRLARRGLA